MSQRGRAFGLVCAHLSAGPRGDIQQATIEAAVRPPSFWTEFIRIATDYLVGPSLAIRFDHLGLRGFVPSLVERHCDALLRLNRCRNAQLHAEALEFAAELNRIDIVPLFLKGGAGLLTGLYNDPGERILGDLDILIPSDRVGDCERLLSRLGYGLAPLVRRPLHQAVGVFLRNSSAAPIDLHREVLGYPNTALLSASEVIEHSAVQDIDGVTVAVPSPTHRIVLNIAHAQLSDHAYAYGHLPLRAFQEFGLLLRQGSGAVDWRLVDEKFAAIGKSGAVAFHCLAAAETLKVEARPHYRPGRAASLRVMRARVLTDRPTMLRFWFRFVRVAVLMRRDLSDAELRERLLRNMRDSAWWRRHLLMFWQGQA